MKKQFVLYWLTGKYEIITGEDVAQAMTLAGYSNGAVAALDLYEEIKTNAEPTYRWNTSSLTWQRKAEIGFRCEIPVLTV